MHGLTSCSDQLGWPSPGVGASISGLVYLGLHGVVKLALVALVNARYR